MQVLHHKYASAKLLTKFLTKLQDPCCDFHEFTNCYQISLQRKQSDTVLDFNSSARISEKCSLRELLNINQCSSRHLTLCKELFQRIHLSITYDYSHCTAVKCKKAHNWNDFKYFNDIILTSIYEAKAVLLNSIDEHCSSFTLDQTQFVERSYFFHYDKVIYNDTCTTKEDPQFSIKVKENKELFSCKSQFIFGLCLHLFNLQELAQFHKTDYMQYFDEIPESYLDSPSRVMNFLLKSVFI